MDPAMSWDKVYARRRERLYLTENHYLKDIEPKYLNLVNIETPSNEESVFIGRFLSFHRKSFDPPAELLYSTLVSFLRLVQSESEGSKVVFLDERRDPTGDTTSTRLWDSEGERGERGYMNYPPKGSDIFTATLSASELQKRMTLEKTRENAGKRVMFAGNITPKTMLTIAGSIAHSTIPAFRDFCHSYLLFRPAFKAQTFNLEFHIPFFALRKASRSGNISDSRLLNGEQFRVSRHLPLCHPGEGERYCYHEAQVSFLVTGVDEWLWTAFCFVDTYFGNEQRWEKYVESQQDPSTAGTYALEFPVWNPRNYFLVALEQRMMQATREWTTLVNKFEERMMEYEKRRREFRDDIDLTHTEELTSVVTAIRRFRDATSSTIEAWDIFEKNHIQHLQTTGGEALRQRWDGYLGSIRGNVSELKILQTLLSRKLEHFNSMRDGFVNAAALRESATSRAQGENIGILTKMTVIYLPLSFATGVFSMAMIPGGSDGLHKGMLFLAWVLACSLIFLGTVYAANFPNMILNSMLPDEGGRDVVRAAVNPVWVIAKRATQGCIETMKRIFR